MCVVCFRCVLCGACWLLFVVVCRLSCVVCCFGVCRSLFAACGSQCCDMCSVLVFDVVMLVVCGVFTVVRYALFVACC